MNAYKAINAPVGTLGLKTLQISTTGLKGNAATFATIDAELTAITAVRNAIASQMIAMIEAAEFNNMPIDTAAADILIDQANDLIGSVEQ